MVDKYADGIRRHHLHILTFQSEKGYVISEEFVSLREIYSSQRSTEPFRRAGSAPA